MNKSLSDKDIKRILGEKTQIITYTDLANISKLEDLFVHNSFVIIIFFTRVNYGHWICLFLNKEGVNFFDPYSLLPDQQLDWKIDDNFRREQNEDYPHLTFLLYDYSLRTGDPIVYNDYKFQKKGNSITTCGRHVIMRILLQGLSCDEYTNYILSLCDLLSSSLRDYNHKGNIDPDKLVTIITNILM